MQPTYSLPEIKSLIRSLDLSSLTILDQLIKEEKECFSYYELRALERFLQVKNRALVGNEVKLDYLLSFN